MRMVVCRAFGPIDGLELGEMAAPALPEDGVRIAVRAAGLNFADILVVGGTYQEKPALPFVPGLELAGEIVEVGAKATRFRTGQRVMATVGTGAFAEQAVARENEVFPLPDGMDFVTGAAFPVAYGTAHLGLTHRAALKVGEMLMVHGAAGGVGLAAVEVGKAVGATVIATASSPEKLALAREHGADHVIDYTKEDVRARLREIAPRGVDVALDPVGGDVFTASLRTIGWEGRIIIVGFAGGTVPQIPANHLLVKNASAMGFYWGAYRAREPERVRASMAEAASWAVAGKLRPHVSAKLPLAEAAKGLKLLAERKATGKVILTVDG
ncbi:MAG: NADPH:quinone oxidoreductase family protein [Alphaproteobacteria bacterium]|nr:NADPH:quinone oxidoreductase family protein [Alphaproteobacteria bacterium]